jgi:hypothetical protein
MFAPIETAQAWHGADLEKSDAWRRLTETEIAALIRAADAAWAS